MRLADAVHCNCGQSAWVRHWHSHRDTRRRRQAADEDAADEADADADADADANAGPGSDSLLCSSRWWEPLASGLICLRFVAAFSFGFTITFPFWGTLELWNYKIFVGLALFLCQCKLAWFFFYFSFFLFYFLYLGSAFSFLCLVRRGACHSLDAYDFFNPRALRQLLMAAAARQTFSQLGPPPLVPWSGCCSWCGRVAVANALGRSAHAEPQSDNCERAEQKPPFADESLRYRSGGSLPASK